MALAIMSVSLAAPGQDECPRASIPFSATLASAMPTVFSMALRGWLTVASRGAADVVLVIHLFSLPWLNRTIMEQNKLVGPGGEQRLQVGRVPVADVIADGHTDDWALVTGGDGTVG